MARIVVLGGSFGGLTSAFELKRILGNKADVTLLCGQEKFVFVPSLPWISMGWKRPHDITLPLKEILEPKGIKFIHEEAAGVDADSAKVLTRSQEISYDYLVIATGPDLVFSAVPGLGPEGGIGNIEAGGNIFTGKDDYTFFAQFENNTNVYGGVRYSF